MTDIATNLSTIDGSLSDIKTAIVAKGVTPSGNITTYATAIGQISGGGGGSTPAERTVKANYYVDTSGVVHNFSGRQTISGSATTLSATQTSLTGFWNMNQAYANKSDLALVDFSAIETMNGTTNINFNQQFTGDANLTAADFSSVTTIEGVANFEGCFWLSSNLEHIDMHNLTTVNVDNGTGMENAIFNYWIDGTKVSELNLDNLTTLAGYASLSGFIQNSLITGDYTFPKLSVLSSQYALNGAFLNSSITSVSFPALTSTSFGSYTSQFYNMLQGLTGITVHFPSNLQSVIGSWSDVTAGFGGTNTTVLFDLTATS